MGLKNMTPSMWDTYVDLYPEQLDAPFKDLDTSACSGQALLQEFSSAHQALALNRVVVGMMHNGRANGLYHELSDRSFVR